MTQPGRSLDLPIVNGSVDLFVVRTLNQTHDSALSRTQGAMIRPPCVLAMRVSG
jgi:hypothetical protein